jgi:hypothetical protein
MHLCPNFLFSFLTSNTVLLLKMANVSHFVTRLPKYQSIPLIRCIRILEDTERVQIAFKHANVPLMLLYGFRTSLKTRRVAPCV